MSSSCRIPNSRSCGRSWVWIETIHTRSATGAAGEVYRARRPGGVRYRGAQSRAAQCGRRTNRVWHRRECRMDPAPGAGRHGAGMTPHEVIVAATRNSAEFLGLDARRHRTRRGRAQISSCSRRNPLGHRQYTADRSTFGGPLSTRTERTLDHERGRGSRGRAGTVPLVGCTQRPGR